MWLLHYVKDCGSTIKIFKTKKELDNFIKKFEVDNDSNWLDYYVEIQGKVVALDPYYE